VGEDDFSRLVGQIYDAAVDPAGWHGALTDVCRHFRAENIVVYYVDRKKNETPFILSLGMPSTVLKEYNEYYISIDKRVGFQYENPSIRTSVDYMHIEESEIDKSEYYDWIHRILGTRYYLGSRLFSATGPIAGVVALQRTKRQGHADIGEAKIFDRFAPHIERALDIGMKLEGANLAAETAFGAIDRLKTAVVVLARDGRILSMNEAAEGIIGDADGLYGGADGLRGASSTDRSALQNAIAGVVRDGTPSSLVMARPSGKRAYILSISSAPASLAIWARDIPSVLIFISDPESVAVPPLEQIIALYGLTITEAGLARALVAGVSLKDYAEQKKRSMHTVRWHLKQIFSKTYTIRQAELIRLLLSSPPTS